MSEKVGRNDPCPCGSGKKFKQCCLNKTGGSGVRRKLQAVWVNKPAQPQGVNLMERTFGNAISENSTSQPSFLTPAPPAEANLPAETENPPTEEKEE